MSNRTDTSGVYAADKARAFPARLNAIAQGTAVAPVHLHLILSDFCELSCKGCSYRTEGYSSSKLFAIRDDVTGALIDKNPKRFLPKEFVQRVLRECADMGTKAIEFTGGGEPTAHPNFTELWNYALQRGLETALVSHGLRAAKLAHQLVRAKWLRISIDAATPEMYGVVRPSVGGSQPALFQKVLDGLSALRKARDEAKMDCVIGAGFVVQEANWKEIYEACRVFKEAGADNIRISGLFSPEWEKHHAPFRARAEALEKEAIADFDGKDGFRVYGRYCQKVEDLNAPPDYDTCSFQQFTTYLGGDGNLYRCCVTSYNEHGLLGNALQVGSFKELWFSEEVQRKLNNFNARSCSRCQFNDRNKAINEAVWSAKAGRLPILDQMPQHVNFV